jgi:hypothetical protein
MKVHPAPLRWGVWSSTVEPTSIWCQVSMIIMLIGRYSTPYRPHLCFPAASAAVGRVKEEVDELFFCRPPVPDGKSGSSSSASSAPLVASGPSENEAEEPRWNGITQPGPCLSPTGPCESFSGQTLTGLRGAGKMCSPCMIGLTLTS